MLTGKPPWNGMFSTKKELLDILKTGTIPRIPKDLTEECRDFLY